MPAIVFPCMQCSASFSYRYELLHHTAKLHTPVNTSKRRLTVPSATSKRAASSTTWWRTQARCRSSVGAASSLLRRPRHFTDTPGSHQELLACTLCAATFSRAHKLKTHIHKCHSDKTEDAVCRQKCRMCDERFAYRFEQLYHETTAHAQVADDVSTPPPLLQCPVCGRVCRACHSQGAFGAAHGREAARVRQVRTGLRGRLRADAALASALCEARQVAQVCAVQVKVHAGEQLEVSRGGKAQHELI